MDRKSDTNPVARIGMSVAEVRLLVKTDPNFPPGRRASALSSLARIPVWTKAADASLPRGAEHIPFTRRTIDALFDRFVPGVVGRSRKRIRNARSDCRFMLEWYGLSAKTLRVGLSEELKALEEKLEKFERIAIRKLFVCLSLHGL